MGAITNAKAALESVTELNSELHVVIRNNFTSTLTEHEVELRTALRDMITLAESLETEMHQRELHHFEAETALGVIKNWIENARYFGDELDHEEILALIPKDI